MSITSTLICKPFETVRWQGLPDKRQRGWWHTGLVYIFKDDIELPLVIRLYFGVPPLLWKNSLAETQVLIVIILWKDIQNKSYLEMDKNMFSIFTAWEWRNLRRSLTKDSDLWYGNRFHSTAVKATKSKVMNQRMK